MHFCSGPNYTQYPLFSGEADMQIAQDSNNTQAARQKQQQKQKQPRKQNCTHQPAAPASQGQKTIPYSSVLHLILAQGLLTAKA